MAELFIELFSEEIPARMQRGAAAELERAVAAALGPIAPSNIATWFGPRRIALRADVSAEVALFDQLLDHAAGCTAVVVSHRFSTVRRAERIVVIADGRVVEDGSHEELVASQGRYARLFELQAQRFRDGAVAPAIAEPSV